MIYEVKLKSPDGSINNIFYDVTTNNILDSNHNIINIKTNKTYNQNKTQLRIAFGQKCNFNCKYCLQQHDHSKDTNIDIDVIKYVSAIKAKFPYISHIGYWGGEGFLYFDLIKKLSKEFKNQFKDVTFSVVTNGSLFKGEIYNWCIENKVSVVISYDGEGQCYRTKDILEDDNIKNNIIKYYKLYPNLISYSTVLSNKNTSVIEFHDYMFNKLGVDISIADSPLIEITDDKSKDCAILDEDILNNLTREMTLGIYKDIVSDKEYKLFSYLISRCIYTSNTIGKLFNLSDTKCFSGQRGNVATVDLKGDILPCQSFISTDSLDGISSVLGSIYDDKEIIKPTFYALKTKQQSNKCQKCLVRNVCKSGCPLSDSKYDEYNCLAKYAECLPILSGALFMITGYMPLEYKPIEE